MPRTPQPCDGIGISSELDDMLKAYPDDHEFNRWIKQDMREALLYNRLCGEPIEKNLIPAKYRQIYGVNNLYRYQHPEGYRSCYTILHMGDNKFNAWILDLLTHQEYEKLFGYSP